MLQSTEVCDVIAKNKLDDHLAEYVVEVGDEDDDEGEAAKDVEEAGHISGTRRAHQIPGMLKYVEGKCKLILPQEIVQIDF